MQFDSGKTEMRQLLEKVLSEEISEFVELEKELMDREEEYEVYNRTKLFQMYKEIERVSEKIIRMMKKMGVEELYRDSWKMRIEKGTSGEEFLDIE